MNPWPYRLSLITMIVYGALDMFRGVAAPLIQHDWHLSYFELGQVFAASSLGYLIGSLLSGFAVQRLGIKSVIVTGLSAMVVGVAGFLFLPTYPGLVIGFWLLGIGTGWAEIGLNAVIPAMAADSGSQAKYFNWLHGLYGAGACAFPIISAWLIRVLGGWKSGYVVLCAALVVIASTTMVVRYTGLQATPSHERAKVGSARAWLGQPALYVLLVAICTYVMAEVAIGAWLPTFLIQARKMSVFAASTYLSGFYLTFTIGRLTAHNWVHRLGNAKSVTISSGIALILMVVALGTGHIGQACFMLAGFGFAVIFPTIVALASESFQDHASKVLGLLFTASGIGSLVVNWLIGLFSTWFGLNAGFELIAVFLALVLISMLVWPLFARRLSEQQTRILKERVQ